jgi:ketosteroid isomerase-like protein
MSSSHHELAREFFAHLSRGELPDELFTEDATVWTNSSGASTKASYQRGVKLLQSMFPAGLVYHVDSLTAEDDRVAAEVQGQGTLASGGDYRNTYVFIFRVRDGRIAAIAEHTNAVVVREKILPLLQAAAKQ